MGQKSIITFCFLVTLCLAVIIVGCSNNPKTTYVSPSSTPNQPTSEPTVKVKEFPLYPTSSENFVKTPSISGAEALVENPWGKQC